MQGNNNIFAQKKVFPRNSYYLQLRATKYLAHFDFNLNSKKQTLISCRSLRRYPKRCSHIYILGHTPYTLSKSVTQMLKNSCKTFCKTVNTAKSASNLQAILAIKLFTCAKSITILTSSSELADSPKIKLALGALRFFERLDKLKITGLTSSQNIKKIFQNFSLKKLDISMEKSQLTNFRGSSNPEKIRLKSSKLSIDLNPQANQNNGDEESLSKQLYFLKTIQDLHIRKFLPQKEFLLSDLEPIAPSLRSLALTEWSAAGSINENELKLIKKFQNLRNLNLHFNFSSDIFLHLMLPYDLDSLTLCIKKLKFSEIKIFDENNSFFKGLDVLKNLKMFSLELMAGEATANAEIGAQNARTVINLATLMLKSINSNLTKLTISADNRVEKGDDLLMEIIKYQDLISLEIEMSLTLENTTREALKAVPWKLEQFNTVNFLDMLSGDLIHTLLNVTEVALNVTKGFPEHLFEGLNKVLCNLRQLPKLLGLRITCWQHIKDRKKVISELIAVLKTCRNLETFYLYAAFLSITESEAQRIEDIIRVLRRMKLISFYTEDISFSRNAKEICERMRY